MFVVRDQTKVCLARSNVRISRVFCSSFSGCSMMVDIYYPLFFLSQQQSTEFEKVLDENMPRLDRHSLRVEVPTTILPTVDWKENVWSRGGRKMKKDPHAERLRRLAYFSYVADVAGVPHSSRFQILSSDTKETTDCTGATFSEETKIDSQTRSVASEKSQIQSSEDTSAMFFQSAVNETNDCSLLPLIEGSSSFPPDEHVPPTSRDGFTSSFSGQVTVRLSTFKNIYADDYDNTSLY
jgi:hypothetical protein